MDLTIARALKLKNRLQSRIRVIASDMESYNSTVSGGTKEVNVRESLIEYERLVDHLIALKVKIFASNLPVYKKILRLAEIKSEIKMLRSVSTQHGKVVDTYRYSGPSEHVEYDANFRKAEIDKMTRLMEEQVDQIQEELDNHNHANFIEIDSFSF